MRNVYYRGDEAPDERLVLVPSEFGNVANDGVEGVDHEAAVPVLNGFAIEDHFKFDGLTIRQGGYF